MSFILMLILGMLVGDLLWWAWAHFSLQSRRTRIALAAFMSVQFGCLLWILIARALGDRSNELIPRFVLAALFLWHFIVLPAAVAVMLVCLSESALGALTTRRGARPVSVACEAGEASPQPTRRDFLRSVAVAAPPVATVLATGASLSQLQDFRIRKLDIAWPNLPEALNGLTIAQVADIHVGRFTSGRVLGKIVDATNNLRADLVLLTGDLINHAISDLPAAIDMVKAMDARQGVFTCEGNHDLMESREGFEQGVKRAGVPLLVNESTMLSIRGQDVQLLGLRWGPGRRDEGVGLSMRQLMTQRVPGAFPILLAHHPHAFDPAAEAGIPLTLSGHTHGGQLMLTERTGFGPVMFRYWSGLYQQLDSRLVVSNGVGNWFPLRINAPAEIVHITLRRG
jgi:predicted MPP superfamily phosphohydrolase